MHKFFLPLFAAVLAAGLFLSAPHAHAAGPWASAPAQGPANAPVHAPEPIRENGQGKEEGHEAMASTFKESVEEFELFLKRHGLRRGRRRS